MTRKYAHDTSVAASRSRAEIDHLLRRWGCDAIQWADDFRHGKAVLRFRWPFEGRDYVCRIMIGMPPDNVLAREYRRPPTEAQLETKRAQRWRALHRVLLLTIKAKLNAVDAGLVTAVEAFLPHMETADGRTVAELAIPELHRLAELGESQLLLSMRGGG